MEEALYKSYMRGSDAKDVLKEFLMRTPSAFQPVFQGLAQGGFREYLESQGLAAGADPNAYKMFSSTTTFPMTVSRPTLLMVLVILPFFSNPHPCCNYPLPTQIAFALESLFPADADLGEREEVSVLVLGARAESSLPPIWWRELLVAFSRVHTRVRVSMMGPDLQASPQLSQGPASVSWPLFHPSKSVLVSHVNGGRCTLHEHPDAVGLLRESDCTVLFNPGFGENPLKALIHGASKHHLTNSSPPQCHHSAVHSLSYRLGRTEGVVEANFVAAARIPQASGVHSPQPFRPRERPGSAGAAGA
jgi:hypothetical protein